MGPFATSVDIGAALRLFKHTKSVVIGETRVQLWHGVRSNVSDFGRHHDAQALQTLRMRVCAQAQVLPSRVRALLREMNKMQPASAWTDDLASACRKKTFHYLLRSSSYYTLGEGSLQSLLKASTFTCPSSTARFCCFFLSGKVTSRFGTKLLHDTCESALMIRVD